MRLDPFQSATFINMGLANYMLKRYGDAAHWWRESKSRQPTQQTVHVALACAYAQSGQLEEARGEAAEVLRINPGFTIERFKRLLVLRKAGLPES